ncbi:MAG TPA: 4-hydroxy-tetrahydrodipicolinate reductase, partial [Chroococcales cyanobacterium]
KKIGVTINDSIDGALDDAPAGGADVFVDYTSASAVKEHVLKALSKGVNVVIGTSGLTADDFHEIEKAAQKNNLGVIACGNFSITAALAKRFAVMAAEHLSHWEIIDYASAKKIDLPSGTTQELAEELSRVKSNRLGRPLHELHGPKEARGAQVAGTPVHSVRLPGYTIAFETIFGLPNERLTIRHDAGTGAEPYVDGTLLAIRRVASVKGLLRGLDNLLFQKS